MAIVLSSFSWLAVAELASGQALLSSDLSLESDFSLELDLPLESDLPLGMVLLFSYTRVLQ